MNRTPDLPVEKLPALHGVSNVTAAQLIDYLAMNVASVLKGLAAAFETDDTRNSMFTGAQVAHALRDTAIGYQETDPPTTQQED